MARNRELYQAALYFPLSKPRPYLHPSAVAKAQKAKRQFMDSRLHPRIWPKICNICTTASELRINYAQELSINIIPHEKHPNIILLSPDSVNAPDNSKIVEESTGLVLDISNDKAIKIVAHPYHMFFRYFCLLETLMALVTMRRLPQR